MELRFKYIGAHQIKEMDSIPDHAAISTTVDLTKFLFPGLDKLVNALLRNFISSCDKYKFKENDKKTYPLLSHPDWLVGRWIENFGLKKMIYVCNFNNTSQSLWFRINKDSKKIITILKDEAYFL